MKKIIKALLLNIILLGSCTTFSPDQSNPDSYSVPEVIEQPKPTAKEIKEHMNELSLVVYANNDSSISKGSGFLFTTDLAITAYHVIEGMNSAFVEMDLDGVRANVTYVKFDIESDIALLYLDREIVSFIPETFTQSEIYSGEKAYIFSYPGNKGSVFSKGNIASYSNYLHFKRIEISAPINSGSSGGLVMNERSEIIGVITSKAVRAQPYCYATTADAIWDLYNSNLPVVSITNLASTYRRTRGTENWNNSFAAYFSVEKLTVTDQDVRYAYSYGDLSSDFSIVFRNNSNRAVKNVEFAIIFLDFTGKPIDTVEVQISDTIYPGTAVVGDGTINSFVIKNSIELGSTHPSKGFRYRIIEWQYAD